MVAKLDKVMHDLIMLRGWKKSLGAFVSLENVHNYGGLAPTQILNLRNLWVSYDISRFQTSISATNKHRGNFKVMTQKESLTSWKLSHIAQGHKNKILFNFFSILTQK